MWIGPRWPFVSWALGLVMLVVFAVGYVGYRRKRRSLLAEFYAEVADQIE